MNASQWVFILTGIAGVLVLSLMGRLYGRSAWRRLAERFAKETEEEDGA